MIRGLGLVIRLLGVLLAGSASDHQRFNSRNWRERNKQIDKYGASYGTQTATSRVTARRSNQLNYAPSTCRPRPPENSLRLVVGSPRVLNYPGYWVQFTVFRLSSLSRSLSVVSEARVSKLRTRARCVCALSIQRLEGRRWRLRRMRANGYGNSIFPPICKPLVFRYLENQRVREPQIDALRWGMTCGA